MFIRFKFYKKNKNTVLILFELKYWFINFEIIVKNCIRVQLEINQQNALKFFPQNLFPCKLRIIFNLLSYWWIFDYLWSLHEYSVSKVSKFFLQILSIT